MKTIWFGRSLNKTLERALRSLAYHLFVDVVPIVILLVLMAYAMALVSSVPARAESTDLKVLAKTFS